MKKTWFWAGLILASVAGATALVLGGETPGHSLRPVTPTRRDEAYRLLLADLPAQEGDYLEYVRRADPVGALPGLDPVSLDLEAPSVVLDRKALTLGFTLPQGGRWVLVLRHRRTDAGLGNSTLGIRVDGAYPFLEAQALELRRQWSDSTKTFSLDRFGDESLPQQVPDPAWLDLPLADTAGRMVDPVFFTLEAGYHELELENRGGTPVELGGLFLVPLEAEPAYATYRQALPADEVLAAGSGEVQEGITLNAIDYGSKNAYNVRMGSLRDPAATPFHPVDRKLNIIDPASWNRSGAEITWALEVPRSGWYSLSLRYNNPNSDFNVFRSIRIDGVIPFAEFRAYAFPAAGSSRWAHHTLADPEGRPYRVYLEAGHHRLGLRAEKEPVTAASRALNMIISHMNWFGIEIMKVTGRTVDRNRTWRLTDYIPKTPDYLEAYTVLLTDIIQDLGRQSSKGVESSVVAGLHTALFKLHKLAEKPDELPLYLQDIYSTSIYDRPVTQILGETVNMLEQTGLGLDMIYLDQTPVARRDGASWLARLGAGFQALLATFTSEKYRNEPSAEVLDVWVSRPITHTDLMQKMVDAAFTPQTGIKVRISVMPEPNRLILATAARRTPDVAMGLPSHIPFDLAIRDAIMDLSAFDDFWDFAGDFSPGAFVPYVMNEKVYGLPETLDFHTLVYRADIFRQLELSVPDTWQDVVELVPELQRFGMNFYHPIAGGLPTLKWFYQTSPLVYQFGGKLYADDGLSVELDDPKTLAGLRYLSELFSLYALQQQVPAFYNSFRFGVIPAGIVDSQTYLQLKYAAPELKGQWAIAPYPGIPDETGNPQRWFIANGVSAVIMKDSEKPRESWEFLKWWLSAETQADFGYRLQSTFGPEYLWFSANLQALEAAPLDPEDRRVILDQVRWQRDVPRTPAQYMLERGLSDIWVNSATAGKSLRTEVDRMIPVINREVTRKMIEFGYVDQDGRPLKPFVVPSLEWIQAKMGGQDE